MDLNALAEKASLILSQARNEEVSLYEPRLLKDETRCLIVRCRVRSARAETGSVIAETGSVIIKQIRQEADTGFSDWASLAFLSGLEAAHGIVPDFLGGNVSERFFLMEDLGGSRTLGDILGGNNVQVAQTTLQTLAVQMAHLHAATWGLADSYQRLRHTLPGAEGVGRKSEAERWLHNRNKIIAWLEAVGITLPGDFLSCLERIAEVYAEPGPWLCFTHGDPAPSNNHIADDGRVRLLDFEYGAFRHALYDITAWNILCPLPVDSVREMNQRFREELAKSCAAARNDRQYADAWGYLCAFRALAILTWIPPEILAENRPWVDATWTARHAVLAAVSRLHQAIADVPSLGALYEAAETLRNSLRLRWKEFQDKEEIATQWPALCGPQ